MFHATSPSEVGLRDHHCLEINMYESGCAGGLVSKD